MPPAATPYYFTQLPVSHFLFEFVYHHCAGMYFAIMLAAEKKEHNPETFNIPLLLQL